MFHTVAFSATISTTNVSGLVTPVVDNTVFISGNNLNIPNTVSQLFGAAPFLVAGTTPTSAQLQSPSLRETWFPNVTPVQVSATLDTVTTVTEWFDNPVPLVVNEGLNFSSDGAPTSGTTQLGAIVWLSDGARQPVTKAKIFTMRATSTITQVANSWVNGALTFNQTLPVAKYDVVGLRAEATGLLAARINFIGASAVTRPGCPGNATAKTPDTIAFRAGRLGVWGTFDSTTPPSMDVLGATGTSQVYYLDLVMR